MSLHHVKGIVTSYSSTLCFASLLGQRLTDDLNSRSLAKKHYGCCHFWCGFVPSAAVFGMGPVIVLVNERMPSA